MRYHITYLFCIALFSFLSKLSNGDPGDTVKAVVVYGDSYLFEETEQISDDYLDRLIDSLTALENPPLDYLEEVRFYRSVQRKTEEQVNAMIDSLFDLDSIPYALINELNLHVSRLPEDYSVPKTFVFIPTDKSPYPANYFYDDIWTERYPFDYPNTMGDEDTSVTLLLSDSAINCTYHHPVGVKKEYKYYGHVTSHFGWRRGRNHNGTDLEAHQWDEIHAAFGGKVRYARFHEGYGKCVVIRHYNGLETLYAHMNVLKVESGDEVEPGTVLGLAGSTGRSRGVHLHFEIRFKGVPINPAHVIDFGNRCLFADTVVLKKYRHSYSVIPMGNDYHVVRSGDYLHKISRRYGVSIEDLCAWNDFSPGRRLRVGEKVRIRE